MIKVKDIQFAKYFLTQEIDINPTIASKLLEFEVIIDYGRTPDTAEIQNNRIIISQPTSLAKFLFIILYTLIKEYVYHGFQQDKLGLGILLACKEYVYSDDNHPPDNISIILSFDKLNVPSVVMSDIIEPIIGKIERLPLVFTENSFVDACEIVLDSQKYSKRFNVPFRSISIHDYPFILVNSSLYNAAAQYSHLIYKVMEFSYGKDKTDKVIKNILLSDDGVISYLISAIKILNGDHIFVMDFLKFFKSNACLSQEDEMKSEDIFVKAIASDNYLSQNIKIADYKYTPHVFKQWHQWSMIVGLIEKQLQPMRGSMWPASEHIKPIEDQHRQMAAIRAKEKGKNQLNFEEMLEVAREWYGHKTSIPGQLAEVMLRENRVWK